MEEVKQGVRGAIDMTRGSPTRLILRFSLPLLVGNIFQQLYNMVDSVVVGRFVGSSALTAVSTGFPIIYLLSSLFIGFSVGATIMIAQYIGAGDRAAVSRKVDTIVQRPAPGHPAADHPGRRGVRSAAHPDPGAGGGL